MFKVRCILTAMLVAGGCAQAGTVADLASAQQELMRAELEGKIRDAKRKADGPAAAAPPGLPSIPAPLTAAGAQPVPAAVDEPQLVEIFGIDAALTAGVLINGLIKHVTLASPDLPNGWRVAVIDANRVVLAKGKKRKEISLSAQGGGAPGAGLPPLPAASSLR
jgi:type IV pilus biogenesis protein PilP